jgi:FkbM family methyltransferase
MRMLRRGRGRLRRLRLSLEDARVGLATPRAMRRLPSLSEPALNVLLARNEYGVYCVPADSRGDAPRTVRRGRVWEADTLRLLRTIDGDVVHAGAFFGDFLPALATSRSATVWAFEPNLLNYRCANVTVYLNGLENVILIRAGLFDQPGEAFVTNSSRAWAPSGGVSRLVFDEAFSDSREAVPLTTIDETIPEDRPVGAVHLDIEGYEQRALAGALRTIERWRPVLVVESVPPADWIEQNLPGYRAAGRVDLNTVLRPEG